MRSLFLNPQSGAGPSISSSVVLCSFVLLVCIVMLVLEIIQEIEPKICYVGDFAERIPPPKILIYFCGIVLNCANLSLRGLQECNPLLNNDGVELIL